MSDLASLQSTTALRRETVLRTAMDVGVLGEEAPLALFLDLDALAENVDALHAAFPAHLDVLHTFAAKANPIVPVLGELRALGMGCEVASAGELAQALAAGHEPERIVFDSPAKSLGELRAALELGVAVNVDSFQELERVRMLVEERPSSSRIGVRINPQVGIGGIAAMSTAGAASKFGIGLEDDGVRERLLDAFAAFPWLTALHVHTGSQGCPLSLIGQGIAKIARLADDINGRTPGRVRTLDIGGGLPVDFEGDDPVARFDDYVDAIAEHAPRALSGDFSLVTEFGRSVIAKQGWTAARVEYTKISGGQRIAITHAGAQVATRTVFAPEAWPIRVRVHDSTGAVRHGDEVGQDVAGPCCFAGDVVASDRVLPLMEPGDWVVLLDTGGYYASAPFGYNSLLEPGVYGVRGEQPELTVFRAPQTMADLLARTGAPRA